ncbi:unnamed protein product [Oppiella nova]|uniref:Uncharacterized protein n=1 Tax=Oppiella nova TaxID=334625 RepID=A0A7R9MHS9_9ACAR|nr:unnamed protein product [Oppiella nova]CAG2177634.1 unnamed protein product [Oppiella nova]
MWTVPQTGYYTPGLMPVAEVT